VKPNGSAVVADVARASASIGCAVGAPDGVTAPLECSFAPLTQKSRAWACYECGKCTATCPIARAGGHYSPRRQVLAALAGDRDGLMADDAQFKCLTCGLCEKRCPAQVAYTDLVRELRAVTRKEGAQPDCPHGGALQSVMRMMARAETKQDRLGWIGPELRTERTTGSVFYWAGCAAYYDAFFTEYDLHTTDASRAAVSLMNRAGVAPVVSADERCCGHDLLWNGDRESFERLARANVELVAASGAETLVTSCAECLRTWSVDYRPYFSGKLPRMIHVTQFIAEHAAELGLALASAAPASRVGVGGAATNGPARGAETSGSAVGASLRVTYQDPCRLGRHLGIYDAPRDVLRALPEIELTEMQKTGASATCCAGGTWSYCDRYAKKIQVGRLREAKATGAEVLVTACPKCQIHFRCAMKDPRLGDELGIAMRDVAQLALEALDRSQTPTSTATRG
jgi:heterodisulfide reductase subunit D